MPALGLSSQEVSFFRSLRVCASQRVSPGPVFFQDFSFALGGVFRGRLHVSDVSPIGSPRENPSSNQINGIQPRQYLHDGFYGDPFFRALFVHLRRRDGMQSVRACAAAGYEADMKSIDILIQKMRFSH